MKALWVAVLMLTLTAGLWLRQRALGDHAYRASTAALNLGDTRSAIAEARVAAACKGSPAAQPGAQRLRTIAHDAEQKGDKVTARSAWLALAEAGGQTGTLAWREEAIQALEGIDGTGTWTTFAANRRNVRWAPPLAALLVAAAVLAAWRTSQMRTIVSFVCLLAASLLVLL